MKIYITRHSLTAWNEEKRLQGWKDSPLTKQGKEDALKLIQHKLAQIKQGKDFSKLAVEMNDDASAKQNKGKENELYNSNAGQIDEGFLKTKIVKAALKNYRKKAVASIQEYDDEIKEEQNILIPEIPYNDTDFNNKENMF